MNPLALERMPEGDWQRWVLEYARLRHWLTYHTFDSRRSEEGFPDLVLCRAPRLIIAELKTEHGRVSGAQQGWRDQLSGVSEFSNYLWRPTDMRLVQDLLR